MTREMLEQYNERPDEFDHLAGHPDPEKLILHSSSQASLLAGREKPFNWEIDEYMSEGALHRYRAIVEIEALVHLAEEGPYDIEMSHEEKKSLQSIYSEENFDAKEVIIIDHIGKDGAKPREHDVKSVEVYIAEKMEEAELGHLVNWLHFGTTSEDTNNIAYNLMLRDVTNEVVVPALTRFADRLAYMSNTQTETPMIGISHGQDASPQTVGKKFAKYLHGITTITDELQEIELTGKFGGAVGNHNPLVELTPDFDWDNYSKTFVESFGFEYSPIEDQRNNHLAVIKLLETFNRASLVTHQTVLNIWQDIRGDILVQELVAGENGSSTMAHKINPWRMENTEALLEQTMRLIEGAKPGLVESRDERDLSDHGWQRAYGDMVGRIVAGLNYSTIQLDRLLVDKEKAESTLTGKGEILSELLQTAGRISGDPEAYDNAVEATQGKRLTLEQFREIASRVLPEGEPKDRTLQATPEAYLGLAQKKAKEAVVGWHISKTNLVKGVLDWRHTVDGLLFDLDDTLVMGDKKELHARVTAISQELDADISSDEMEIILQTNGWKPMIDEFVRSHNDKHPDQIISAEQFIETNKLVSGSFDHLLEIADQAHELLDILDRKRKKKAIVTARGPNSLPRVMNLHGLDVRFDAIVNGTETAFGKPHPHTIGLALSKLGVSASRAMMVGDHQLKDIVPANAHGVRSVLVNDGELDPMGAKPTIHVKNLAELSLKFAR